MKLLIISGPYEADRLRKAAVSAGFEAVAVEPGESLSGWITASRPALIVMAPQMVHPDPEQALAKVRSVPRGRVPIFLVGDAADEARMTGIADGFFIRPVSPDELLERARTVLAALAKEGGNGARPRTRTGEVPVDGPRPRTRTGEVPVDGTAAGQEFVQGGRTPKGGAQLGRPAAGLRPLKARAVASPPRAPAASRPPADASAMLAKLGASIDDLFDADLSSALATAPRVATAPEGEREFDDMPTDDRRQRSASDRRSALLKRYALVEEGDYFEVLGIGRDATAADVKRAHDRIARELAPDEIDPAVARELGAKLDAIREVVGEALRVLGDERLRPRYQNSLS
jgi:CheY-like chemotaxis protein